MTNKMSNNNKQIKYEDYDLDQRQVAKILKVSTKTVRNWANKKPKKSGDPHLSKQMLLDANRAPSPRYSKTEVRKLKKLLAERKRDGKQPEPSAMESGNSALETTSVKLPDFDLNDFPDAQKPFVFMVYQANSERRALQTQVNELSKKTGNLEKELELKSIELKSIEKEKKTELEDRDHEAPDLEPVEDNEVEEQTETPQKYVIWFFVGMVLIGFILYVFLLNSRI